VYFDSSLISSAIPRLGKFGPRCLYIGSTETSKELFLLHGLGEERGERQTTRCGGNPDQTCEALLKSHRRNWPSSGAWLRGFVIGYPKGLALALTRKGRIKKVVVRLGWNV
jgi:hypothetical protein